MTKSVPMYPCIAGSAAKISRDLEKRGRGARARPGWRGNQTDFSLARPLGFG